MRTLIQGTVPTDRSGPPQANHVGRSSAPGTSWVHRTGTAWPRTDNARVSAAHPAAPVLRLFLVHNVFDVKATPTTGDYRTHRPCAVIARPCLEVRVATR
jgi:hypothetical protein